VADVILPLLARDRVGGAPGGEASSRVTPDAKPSSDGNAATSFDRRLHGGAVAVMVPWVLAVIATPTDWCCPWLNYPIFIVPTGCRGLGR
jgi:hypothetical protein